MSFPWTDPQFWIVTVAAITAGRILVRQVIPGSGGGAAGACGSCAAGAAACARRPAAGDEGLVTLGSGKKGPP